MEEEFIKDTLHNTSQISIAPHKTTKIYRFEGQTFERLLIQHQRYYLFNQATALPLVRSAETQKVLPKS